MKVAIVGAGITGLALAWYLQQHKGVAITLFEASERVGGWINTREMEGALLETGPKTLRMNTQELSSLIQELGLQKEMIIGAASSKKRYIVHKGRLEPLPSSLFGLISSPLGRKLVLALLREPWATRSAKDDESVQEFFERRIGKKATDTFLSALCSGIYAADPGELSMRSAFGKLWQYEQQFGSLVFGALRSKRGARSFTFSFNNGLRMLPETLRSKLTCDLRLNRRVSAIRQEQDVVLVESDKTETFDYLFAAIQPKLFCTLFKQGMPLAIPQTSVVSCAVGYEEAQSIPDGFGFLCPRNEDPELLGAVFDSSLFPLQNGPFKTRLTFMMAGSRAPHLLDYSDEVLMAYSKKFAQKYLRIEREPDFAHVIRAKEAISCYPVGHYRIVEALEKSSLEDASSQVKLIGSGLYGVSVGDSVRSAYQASSSFLLTKKSPCT